MWAARLRVIPVAGALSCLLVSGCSNPDSAVGFDESSPAARLRAIRQAGELGDKSAIPGLIGELESDDPAERFMAIRTLEKLTGQTLGYDHSASPDDRRESAGRWSKWYSEQPGMPTKNVDRGGRI